MEKQERKAYLEAIRERYHKAGRREKSKILDEFCAVCGYHRKYALRRLNEAPQKSKAFGKKKPGPASTYCHDEILTVLRALWLATDQLASKRLKAALPLWLPHYKNGPTSLSETVRDKVLRMSPATIDRLLLPVRATAGRKGLGGTKPGTLLKTQIPLQTSAWDVSQPGFMEADTVAHCGNSLAGQFVWSLTMTDLYSGWTECRATWNKGAMGVMAQIQDIQQKLPFPVQGFDCDNGSEFLNWHLLRYFQNQKNPIAFTRSRPYHSNDNAHVEQKNWSCVRQLLGYDRFDYPALVDLMNDLYTNEFSLLINFFYPTMKLKEKTRVGAQILRKHASPETPAQRLLAHSEITEVQKIQLRATLDSLNPFELQAKIQAKLKTIFYSAQKLPSS